MAKPDAGAEPLGGRRKRKAVPFEDEIDTKRPGKNKAIDPFMQKFHARPINGKWKLISKLGQGGFGPVYLAKHVSWGAEVALKLEHRSTELDLLRTEAQIYEDFQGYTGFPEVYWYGWHDQYKVMAFELLGPSLQDLFEFCERHFSLKTVLMLIDQLLRRLKALHKENVLHRDIKPQNCLLGCGLKDNVVYITDFGLAQYTNPADDRDTTPTRPRLVGTAKFASIRGHEGRVQSAKDDLESLGYMMVYFLQGQLPWQGGEASTAAMEKQQTVVVNELCRGLPAEFAEFLSTVRSLRHRETPSYDKFRQSFRNLARREGICYDNVFDWSVRLYLQQAGKAG